MTKRALLVVDVQNAFMPGGNLPVPEGDRVVPVINKLMAEGDYDLVVASQDWHPANHGSFASQHPGRQPFEMGELGGQPQVMWPDHAVQDTEDAEFHPDINPKEFDIIQQKGKSAFVDSYSAFRDNDKAALTGLHKKLIAAGITELDVCGLATEYCVKFSALDAKELLPGVKIRFISDASRGIDPAAVVAAEQEMQAAGIEIVHSQQILTPGATISGEALTASGTGQERKRLN